MMKKKEFEINEIKEILPISIGKLYGNEWEDASENAVLTRTDDFPFLESGKSTCYRSDKPISKMFIE